MVVTALLLLAQVLILLVVLLPTRGEIVNEVLSKYVLTLLETVLTLPSIVVSMSAVVRGVNVAPNVLLYVLSAGSNLAY